MTYENIVCQSEIKGISVIKFNRPKVLNAINIDMLSELQDALKNIATDQNIKVLILTGEGTKAFIAGADIGFMQNFSPLDAKRFAQNGQHIFSSLEAMPIPVIACVNGFALGGGAELAMACDIIYASENAKFGQPETNLGLIPGFGGTQRLTRLIGRNRALEMCLTGKIINAKEALEIGLINKIFAPDQLWSETVKVAELMASKGRVATRAIKSIIRKGIECDLDVGCIMESDGLALCFSSNDAKEGIKAFLEKRSPNFKDNI